MCSHAAEHVLGTPAISYFHTDQDFNAEKMWFDLVHYDKNDAIMLCGSNHGSDKYLVDGIAQGHAYTILSVYNDIKINNMTLRLLKLRNPWGSGGEWTGAWSDNSKLWTDDLKEKFGLTKEDDGTFFIEF